MFQSAQLCASILALIFACGVQRKVSIESPHFFVICYFLVYGLLQCALIFSAEKDHTLETFYLMDVRDIISEGVPSYCAFIFVYAVAALLQSNRLKTDSLDVNALRRKLPTDASLMTLGLVSIAISVSALIGLLAQSGRGLVESILDPQKVYFELAGSADTSYTANGYLSMLASIAAPASYVLFLKLQVAAGKGSAKYYWMFLLLALIYLIYCHATSSRGMIFSYLVTIFIIIALLGRRLPRVMLFAALGLFLALFSFITLKRVGDDEGGIIATITSIGLYTGGATLFNTVMIERWFPETSYYHGASLLWVLYAPVPRTLWPEKPLVALDEVVAREVYGYSDAAFHTAPPGILGEFIMNFGMFGALAGLLLVFLVINRISFYVRGCLALGSPFMVIVYAVIFSRLSYYCLSSSLTAAIMNSLTSMLSISAVFIIAKGLDRLSFKTDY